jgi:hypothetical protein
LNAPDFAAIIDAWDSLRPEDLLAAKVPAACQTCGGTGSRMDLNQPIGVVHDHTCTACPSIATLLAYGWNVASAPWSSHVGNNLSDSDNRWVDGLNARLAALRTIEVAS